MLVAWEALIRLLHVPAYILPSPGAVLVTTRGNWRGLLAATGTTASPMLLGYLAAAAIGIPIARMLARAPRAHGTASPILAVLQLTPLVAIGPLLIIWFGFGLVPKTLLVFLLAVIPIAAATPPTLFRACKTAAATAASTAVVADFAASDRGLGYLLLEAGGNVDTPTSFAALACLSALGLALCAAVALVERLLTPQRHPAT